VANCYVRYCGELLHYRLTTFLEPCSTKQWG